jgi:cell division protein FtsW
MVFNTTSAEILNKSLEVNTNLALVKQFIYGMCGVLIGLFVWLIGYHKIIKISPYLLSACVFLLILVFVPKIGQTINGAKRWVGIASLTLQPSEFAKFIIPIYFVYYATKNNCLLELKDFLKVILLFSIPISLILIEPDTGTTIIILSTLVIMFVLMKIKFSYWALPLLIFVFSGAVTAYNMPHVRSRINVYLHPELDLLGKGHQPYQAKIAVGSGKLTGRGLGESMQKLDYLPEARSDYIAAIYAEEFGFFGIIFLIALYMCIFFAGFSIAMRAKDKVGFYLAGVLTFLISYQAFLNLGVVSCLLPSKGVTLPFFSQGGTSLIVNIVAIFLLLNIASQKKEKEEEECLLEEQKY